MRLYTNVNNNYNDYFFKLDKFYCMFMSAIDLFEKENYGATWEYVTY